MPVHRSPVVSHLFASHDCSTLSRSEQFAHCLPTYEAASIQVLPAYYGADVAKAESLAQAHQREVVSAS